MKKKNDDTSPIFSILDGFTLPLDTIYEFIDLGVAAMGTRHVLVLFHFPHSTELHVDKDSNIQINKFLTLYDIHGGSGNYTYGYLFVLKDSDRFEISNNTLVYKNKDHSGDYTLFPYTNDKNHIFIYKDGSNNVLVNISNIVGDEFIVLDV